MQELLTLVKEFRETFGLPLPAITRLPTEKEREFQANMICDEATEMYEAESIGEYLDGIVDVLYFAFGAALEAGIPADKLLKQFKAVHKANMTKLWSDAEVTAMPNNVRAQYLIRPVFNDPTKYIVRYMGSGKVAKPPSWREPLTEI